MDFGDILGVDWNSFLINLIIAAILFLLGILIGNVVKLILKKIAKKSGITSKRGYNFFKLFITVVTWSIYIIFLNFALVQLKIPLFTSWISSVILIIPAITGSLILIAVGFVIASYLSRVIEESKIEGCESLSKIFWYFILYIFLVFALKTALISVDSKTVNYLILILTAIIGASVAFSVFRSSRK